MRLGKLQQQYKFNNLINFNIIVTSLHACSNQFMLSVEPEAMRRVNTPGAAAPRNELQAASARDTSDDMLLEMDAFTVTRELDKSCAWVVFSLTARVAWYATAMEMSVEMVPTTVVELTC